MPASYVDGFQIFQRIMRNGYPAFLLKTGKEPDILAALFSYE